MRCWSLFVWIRCSCCELPSEVDSERPPDPEPSPFDASIDERVESESSIHESQTEEATPSPPEPKAVEAGAELETEELTSLWNEEDFLVKVFQYIVEDGLHECRRVCKKWRRLCERVNPNICLNRHAKNLENIHRYRNAVDLKYTEEDMFNFFCSEEKREGVRQAFLTELPHFTSLRRLTVNSEKDKIFPQIQECRLAILKQLESLCIICTPYSVDVPEMLSALRQLSKLTALEIQSTCSTRGHREPLTDLTGIRDLRVPINLLFNSNGELLFPALTALSCLEIKQNRCTIESRVPVDRRLLRALEPYMESLITLRILTWSSGLFGDVSLFSCFTGLGSLQMSYPPDPQALFFETLGQMRFLTELILMRSPYRDSTAMPESLLHLSNLRSFTFNHGHQNVVDLMQRLPLAQMTRLTELHAGVIRMPYNFGALTSLIKLELENLVDFYCCDPGDVYLSNAVLSNFRLLQELTINCVAVDDDLLPMLATFSGLTSLGILNLVGGKEEMVFPQVNLVTNLRRLTLQSETLHNPVQYLKLGKLRNLREFRGMSRVIVRDDELYLLYAGLPCIRRILRR